MIYYRKWVSEYSEVYFRFILLQYLIVAGMVLGEGIAVTEQKIANPNGIVNSIDLETGEILPGKTHKKREPRWFKAYRENLKRLAFRGLSAREWDVFIYLSASMQVGNKCQVHQGKLAKKLETTPRTIYTSLNRLQEMGLIKSNGKIGQISIFEISSEYCAYGFLGK